ncbi:hypothetical protein ACVT81_000540 [Yersinia enterocolitica]|uniref:hypothetical protein n=1 Tax=Yersinia enterocolitica TaxID=630 RepID=UPI0027ED1B29|nr:hypothetical protein [Yersinia enterocolitica]EKN4744685.1 hypothetical protein [Yersinia enterocolitica]EKN4839821.1 hypothetical protein [Yersinia enterocolitica]HDL6528875.1 hypothetical protein [Yersinia enterocolitica]HDL6667184.1 hypothetical protein [Yersinia enterocolitica]
MLSKEPVRIRRDWDVAIVAPCDFCSHSKMTVPHADGGKICASCCDAEFLSNWQSYARNLATELISVREQLAEIKGDKLAEPHEPIQKKLIGWRMEDYTNETNSIELARNWAPNIGVLPIFEGDINTSISTTTIDTASLTSVIASNS